MSAASEVISRKFCAVRYFSAECLHKQNGMQTVTIDDVFNQVVALHPDQIALKDIHTGREWSYRALKGVCSHLAVVLGMLGLKKGDRAVIVANNSPGHVILLLACARIGAVTTPINSLLSTEQMVEVINDSQATLVFYSANFSALADRASELPNVRHFVHINDDGSEPFAGLLAEYAAVGNNAAAENLDEVAPGDILYQIYTSGTTGKSKGAMITHANVLADLTGLSYALHVDPGDKVLIATPYFHGAAVMMTIIALAHGGTCIVSHNLRSNQLIKALSEEHVTFCFVVPGMIINMVKDHEIRHTKFSDLKALVYGAAPIPQQIQYEALGYFGQKLVQIYGQTEAVMTMTLLRAQEHEISPSHPNSRRLQSVGRQIFGCEVRVFDENDRDVNVGQIGEVVARGGNIMPGYHNLPEATASTLRGGWLRTGDLATVDADGYIYLGGRKKDLIICYGENVYPVQVEQVIDKHQGVLESAVIGIPHPIDGEQVKAFVVAKPGSFLKEADVIEHCRKHLGEFQCPKSVDIVPVFPRNTGGKILKTELRKSYW